MAELTKGANAALAGTPVEIAVSGVRPDAVDLLAFQVGAGGTVRSDADLVFFNQPASPEGAVRLTAPHRVSVDLARVPAVVETIAVCVAMDEGVPGPLTAQGALEVRVEQPGTPPVTAPAIGLSTERAAVLVEIYRRAGGWKVRSVSAGWSQGTAALAREYGVAVDEPAPPQQPAPQPIPPTAPTAPIPPTSPTAPTAPVVRPAAPGAGTPASQVVPAGPAPRPGGFPPPGGVLAAPAAQAPALVGGFPPPGGDPPPVPPIRVPALVGGFPPPGTSG